MRTCKRHTKFTSKGSFSTNCSSYIETTNEWRFYAQHVLIYVDFKINYILYNKTYFSRQSQTVYPRHILFTYSPDTKQTDTKQTDTKQTDTKQTIQNKQIQNVLFVGLFQTRPPPSF